MTGSKTRVFFTGTRDSIREAMLNAASSSDQLEPASSPAEADLIVQDVCSYEDADLSAIRAERPVIVLSLLGADRARPGSFPAEVAARESAVVAEAEQWCVLRCAAFGEELAWNTRYAAEGQLLTAWQPEGAPWLAAADVVALIGKLVRTQDRWHAAYDVTGPATVPMAQVCDLLHDLQGRTLHYVQLEPDVLSSSMEKAGFDPVFAARRTEYMSWATSAACRAPSPLLAEALGHPPTALSQYLLRSARSSLTPSRQDSGK
ncbi:Rossmann-fold NAD(P)-binding domain-containing protein [Nocardiopsis xinjiangensis]|uniref:hypothetical protein n=1 Tax=Nocardiopsis xinjiangensis TaxID=124285 RepID=UPI00034AF307|nr:hypothetical protein [Nocardiopsis xinjiangensis]